MKKRHRLAGVLILGALQLSAEPPAVLEGTDARVGEGDLAARMVGESGSIFSGALRHRASSVVRGGTRTSPPPKPIAGALPAIENGSGAAWGRSIRASNS